MSIRENLERMEEISLSPFATLSVNSRGRDREELFFKGTETGFCTVSLFDA